MICGVNLCALSGAVAGTMNSLDLEMAVLRREADAFAPCCLLLASFARLVF